MAKSVKAKVKKSVDQDIEDEILRPLKKAIKAIAELRGRVASLERRMDDMEEERIPLIVRAREQESESEQQMASTAKQLSEEADSETEH